MIVKFVDVNRAEFGVEPVCAALQVAPSTYWSATRRPPSALPDAAPVATRCRAVSCGSPPSAAQVPVRQLGTASKTVAPPGPPKAARPPDTRTAGCGLTHVATWSGVAYVCFITDAFSRRIVGWRVASTCAPRRSSTRWKWPAGAEAHASKVS